VAGLTKFKAGYQLLTGQEVLDYVRIAEVTKGNDTIHGEYARLARQDQVIMLLFTQMSRPETLLRLPALANTFYGQVVTDLSMSQMLDLACVFKDSSFSLRYLQIGPELVSRNEQSLVPKPDAVDAFLKENFLP
jgi:anionic cell wall polymer biosynthesis LytR-Cps2A-Psr (LCP) family protein